MTAAAAHQGAFPAPIVFTEAIKDSPRFRASLAEQTLYFQRLENRLNEMLKHLTAMIDYSKNYVNSFYRFTASINQLRDESFADNALAQSTFNSLSEAFGQTVNLSKAYYEEATMQVYDKVAKFVKHELSKIADARIHFEQMSSSMDEALAKNATISRTKPGDVVDGRNSLTAVGACFAHTTLDYCAQLNITHAHKDQFIVDALWCFVKETSVFFSRGHAVFDEWTAADNGAIADSLAALSGRSKHTERRMQDVHSLVPKELFQHPSGMSPDPDVMMEGYLMKRSSNAFKTWNRRWFQIKENKLLYSHRSAEAEEPTVMEENLKLCLVRPAPPSVDRVGCFELVTPTRSHLLQADSESLCNAWMRALQRTILALHESTSIAPQPSSSRSTSDQIVPNGNASAFDEIRKVSGNDKCADCGCSQPKWVSINLGVVLCIECSGVHRSLGVQVSKVRSLTMDSIDCELKDLLLSLGNDKVNGIYLAHLPVNSCVPPTATSNSNRQVREAWIRAKYVERRFAVRQDERARCTAHLRSEHLLVKQKGVNGVNRSSSYADVKDAENRLSPSPCSDDLHVPDIAGSSKRLSSCGSDPNVSAIADTIDMSWNSVAKAAGNGDIPMLLTALAHNIDLNAVHDGRTALHIATKAGQTVAVEFLLLNGAKINVLDERLNTPLHLAASEGNTLQVCQLLKRGADRSLKNADGVTPLDVAMEGKHADIVTLFRVTTMRDEFNEEFDNPMNETVDSVISDITRRAAANTRPAS